MATSSAQQDSAIDQCMDATDAFLEQHSSMCKRLKEVQRPRIIPPHQRALSSPRPAQAIFLLTRCRRDLNLSAIPVDLMIPRDLQPLLTIRCSAPCPLLHLPAFFTIPGFCHIGAHYFSEPIAQPTAPAPHSLCTRRLRSARTLTRAFGSRQCRRRTCDARGRSL
jgi:hypothetical protein